MRNDLHPPRHDGRFAPSPTGELHFGNLRTAMLAWLFARARGARFIVRVEDLDPDRVKPGLADRQLADLHALGLDWDDQPVWQTTRAHLYRQALEQLRRLDRVYPCFCTRAEIRQVASAPHGPGPDGAYPGTCSQLSAEEARRRIAAGEPACLRFRGLGERVGFVDGVLGEQRGFVDDFVVQRKDGVAAYNLAVVVDDASQGIGEVVRGADLVDSTPRQLALYDALDERPPTFAHVPLVLGPDGQRLAKRHGAVTLADWLRAGRTAGALRSALATSVGIRVDGPEPSMRDLLERFEPTAVPTTPTVLHDLPGANASVPE